MIISASRRTDIPAFYADWFVNRLRAGFVCVRNPHNPRQIGKIDLSPDVVDGIVLWTKNPSPMIDRLDALRDYPYYFQCTLTAYDRDVEANLPSKNEVLIPAFQRLSKRAGKERVVWRYDPILFNARYTMAYHLRYFRLLAERLAGYTEKCTVSFLDFYPKIERNLAALGIVWPTAAQKEELLLRFSEIASQAGLAIDTCAEDGSYHHAGVPAAHCIDSERLERIGGYRLAAEKDKNQRAACGCCASVDIGAYDSCGNGCQYCYANHQQGAVLRRMAAHQPDSPLLLGRIEECDQIKVREAVSLRWEPSLFDCGR